MNCREFEPLWNEWLDAPDRRQAVAVGRALADHAESCPACGAVAKKYQTLRSAIAAWRLSDTAGRELPAGLADRVVSALPPPARSRPLLIFRPAARFAAAAAVFLAIGIAWQARDGGRGPQLERPGPSARSASLGEALAGATSATLDLARQTSTPAARVGRTALAAADPSGAAIGLPSLPETPPQALRSFGDGVNAGVRPLAGTAERIRLPGPDLRRRAGPQAAPLSRVESRRAGMIRDGSDE